MSTCTLSAGSIHRPYITSMSVAKSLLPALLPSDTNLALWRTAPGDAVLERSIEILTRQIFEGPQRDVNFGTKQAVSS